jgi:phosphohistidine phosphatase
MKTLYLVRHAKSDWSTLGQPDHDRTLAERGLRDAPRMGELLRGVLVDATTEKNIPPLLLVSSSAVRAKTTAHFFANALSIDNTQINIEKAIYDSSKEEMMDVIHDLDDTHNIAILFGHNPTFTYLANTFVANVIDFIDNMPTCSIVRIESKAQTWATLSKKNSVLTGFWYPKML